MLNNKLLGASASVEQISAVNVFSSNTYTGNGGTQSINNGINLLGNGGLVWTKSRDNTTFTHHLVDSVRGVGNGLCSNTTAAQVLDNYVSGFTTTGFTLPAVGATNGASSLFSSWTFREAPKFFDIVTWTGDGSQRSIPHNLGATPGCIFIKQTSGANAWIVYHRGADVTIPEQYYMFLNSTGARTNSTSMFGSTAPTSTTFRVSPASVTNASGSNYVAFVFGHDTSAEGLIQCGRFTGNGTNQTINCGFSAGARFVLIKRTDSTGDWYVWDAARGIIAGNDPHLSMNSTAADVTTDDSVDPVSTGFIVNQLAATNINVSSASYLFLAIA